MDSRKVNKQKLSNSSKNIYKSRIEIIYLLQIFISKRIKTSFKSSLRTFNSNLCLRVKISGKWKNNAIQRRHRSMESNMESMVKITWKWQRYTTKGQEMLQRGVHKELTISGGKELFFKVLRFRLLKKCNQRY